MSTDFLQHKIPTVIETPYAFYSQYTKNSEKCFTLIGFLCAKITRLLKWNVFLYGFHCNQTELWLNDFSTRCAESEEKILYKRK